MIAGPQADRGRRGSRAWLPATALAAILAVSWAWISALLVAPSYRAGEISYVDADCYMRLARVGEIMEKGQYPFIRFPDSNPPWGETSHWGLPLDIALIGGATLLTPITGSFARALESWSIWIGPALFAVFAFVMISRTRRFAGPLAAGALVMLMLGSQAILHPFLPARPDHHGLLLFLHALAFALFTRAESTVFRCAGQRNAGGAALFGSAALCAVAVWASIESFVLVALFAAWLAIRVVWPGKASRAARTDMLLRWGSATLLALLGAWWVEGGGRIALSWASDSLSPRFLIPGALALFAAWAFRGLLESRHRRVRLFSMLGIVAIAAAAWAAPNRLFQPHTETDFRLMLGFLDKASTDGMPMFNGTAQGLRNFAGWYGLTFLLLPFTIGMVLRARGIRGSIGRLALLCASVYGALGFFKMRWCPYAMMFAAPLVAAWLAVMVARCRQMRSAGSSQALAWAAVLMIATAVGFGGRIAASRWPSPRHPAISTFDLDAGLRLAKDAWRTDMAGKDDRKVLTHVALGPEIMYRWKACVVATPDVRNGAGIRRLFRWLLATDLESVLAELRDGGWTHAVIVSDPLPDEVDAYRRFARDETDLGKTFLGAALRCGPPDLIGQWPLGSGGPALKLIRLPSTDPDIARWLAQRPAKP